MLIWRESCILKDSLIQKLKNEFKKNYFIKLNSLKALCSQTPQSRQKTWHPNNSWYASFFPIPGIAITPFLHCINHIHYKLYANILL